MNKDNAVISYDITNNIISLIKGTLFVPSKKCITLKNEPPTEHSYKTSAKQTCSIHYDAG